MSSIVHTDSTIHWWASHKREYPKVGGNPLDLPYRLFHNESHPVSITQERELAYEVTKLV